MSADGERLILKDYVHIGIAVNTPHGLIVPVIRDADRLRVGQISDAIAELGRRAQDRRIRPADAARFLSRYRRLFADPDELLLGTATKGDTK